MNTLSAQDELAFIRKIMSDSRSAITDDGKPTMVWGVIVAIGMGLSYLEALTDIELYVGWMWIGLSVLGWAYVLYYKNTKVRKQQTNTFAGKVLASLWGSVGVTIGLVVSLTLLSRALELEFIVHPIAITAIIALILGIAYYLNGVITGLNWLRNIAYGWWLAGIYMFLFPSIHVLGIYFVLVIVFQIIPGIVLYRNAHKGIEIP